MKKTIIKICVFSIMICLVITSCKKKEEEQVKDCTEKISPDCICPQNYAPVCGCNNKTYGNACMASCSGITNYTNGECK